MADKKPDSEQLAALLVLVYHFDQLAPLLPPTSERELWQTTDEFKKDHRKARGLISELLLLAGNEELYGAIEETLGKLSVLVSTCEESLGAELKPSWKIKVTPLSLWEDLLGMHEIAEASQMDTSE